MFYLLCSVKFLLFCQGSSRRIGLNYSYSSFQQPSGTMPLQARDCFQTFLLYCVLPEGNGTSCVSPKTGINTAE